MRLDELLREARRLPGDEREALIAELQSEPADFAPEVEAAWTDELRRRLDALDRGEATLIPADQALASARERVAARRLRRAS